MPNPVCESPSATPVQQCVDDSTPADGVQPVQKLLELAKLTSSNHIGLTDDVAEADRILLSLEN